MRNKAKLGQAGGSGRWRVGDPIMRNKANLRGGELEANRLSHKGLGKKVRTVRRRRTKPIWREEGGRRQGATGRSIAPNKANLSIADFGLRIWDRSSASGPRKPVMQNKAKPGQDGVSGGWPMGAAYCAERSQFLRPAGAPEGEMRKTKPIWSAVPPKHTLPLCVFSAAGGQRLDGVWRRL
jgi:hypothetical protein